REIREAGTALGIASVAGRAVVAEQRVTGFAYPLHQRRIGLDRGIVLGRDLLGPGAAVLRGFAQGGRDDLALINAEKALGKGVAKRPGRHQHPVADREQDGDGQEEIDRARHRRVQLGNAVPFVAGGEIAGEAIALWLVLYRHVLSPKVSFLYGLSS